MGLSIVNGQVILTCDELIVTNDITISSYSTVFVVWMPAGTRMMFQTVGAPAGWSKDTVTSGLDGSAVLSTIGSVVSGGATSDLIDTHNHAIGTHSHSLSHNHGSPTSFTHNHSVGNKLATGGGLGQTISFGIASTVSSTGRVWTDTNLDTANSLPLSSTDSVSTNASNDVFNGPFGSVKYLHTIVATKL